MPSDPSPGPGERSEGVSPRGGDDWGQEAVLDELMATFDCELGQTATADRSDQVPECMDAGFLPRGRVSGPAITNLACGGRGTGFASGAELDTALPGPALAGFADAAAGSDRAYTDLDDDELIGALTAWQKTEAWAASGKLSAVAELIRRRPGEAGMSDGPAGAPVGWGKFCSDELAAALASSQRAAERMLGVAYDLAFRLPRTTQALSEGLIDSYKAQIIAEATRVLDDAGAAAAESLVLADVAGKTPGQIRAMIGRAILRVDPDAARQRREQAQRNARVDLWREDVGTAALCGFGLPPDEALAADQMISSRALELKAAGMAGTMDQLRVRAYLDVLLGQGSSRSWPARIPLLGRAPKVRARPRPKVRARPRPEVRARPTIRPIRQIEPIRQMEPRTSRGTRIRVLRGPTQANCRTVISPAAGVADRAGVLVLGPRSGLPRGST